MMPERNLPTTRVIVLMAFISSFRLLASARSAHSQHTASLRPVHGTIAGVCKSQACVTQRNGPLQYFEDAAGVEGGNGAQNVVHVLHEEVLVLAEDIANVVDDVHDCWELLEDGNLCASVLEGVLDEERLLCC